MDKEKNVAQLYKRKQIESATPGELIIILYDAAIDFLNKAEAAFQKVGPESIETYHTNLIRCQDVITELMAALDMEKGGEIAENLYRLYDFMHYRLIDANMHKDQVAIQEVKNFLVDLRETWKEVVKSDPSAQQPQPPSSTGLNIQG